MLLYIIRDAYNSKNPRIGCQKKYKIKPDELSISRNGMVLKQFDFKTEYIVFLICSLIETLIF
jgi:hypothetical protein